MWSDDTWCAWLPCCRLGCGVNVHPDAPLGLLLREGDVEYVEYAVEYAVGLTPATTYAQVSFVAPLELVRVVLKMPLVSRYLSEPHALRWLLAATNKVHVHTSYHPHEFHVQLSRPHVLTKFMPTCPPVLSKFMTNSPHVLTKFSTLRPHMSSPPSRHQCQVPPRLLHVDGSLLQRLLSKHPGKVNAKSCLSETVHWYKEPTNSGSV